MLTVPIKSWLGQGPADQWYSLWHLPTTKGFGWKSAETIRVDYIDQRLVILDGRNVHLFQNVRNNKTE